MCTMLNDSEMTFTVASAIQFQSVSTLCYSNPLLSFHARLLSNELTWYGAFSQKITLLYVPCSQLVPIPQSKESWKVIHQKVSASQF